MTNFLARVLTNVFIYGKGGKMNTPKTSRRMESEFPWSCLLWEGDGNSDTALTLLSGVSSQTTLCPLPLHDVVMIKFLVVIALFVPLLLFQCLGTEPRALHMLKISI